MSPIPNSREHVRFRTTRGLATFTALVALLAILSDAAVGHALIGTVVLVILLGLALVATTRTPTPLRRIR